VTIFDHRKVGCGQARHGLAGLVEHNDVELNEIDAAAKRGEGLTAALGVE